MKTIRVLIGIGMVAAAFGGFSRVQAAPSKTFGSHQTILQLETVGTISLPAGVSGGPAVSSTNLDPRTLRNSDIPRQQGVGGGSLPTIAPMPVGKQVVSGGAVGGWKGVSHFDQRNAGTGIYVNTQFSLEPPDQGLCEGNGYVMEPVNNAVDVYTTNGIKVTGPVAMSQFFGVSPEINRITGVRGDFISDPKCYYDAALQRFFLTELDIATNGRTYTLIAVSQGPTPIGNWKFFRFDTTNDGLKGTPSDPGCPCFGDQPLIGADDYGFFVSTNEFGVNSNAFNGAQIYAISKQELATAALGGAANIKVVLIQGGNLPDGAGGFGPSYSVQPATNPNPLSSANGEYFLSALQYLDEFDNRIAQWHETGTNTLGTPFPNLSLSNTIVTTETYGQPPPALEMPCTVPSQCPYLGFAPELQTNDDRMNNVVYANGLLYGALNTLVQDPGTTSDSARTAQRPIFHCGIAYFIVNASTATIANNGYVAITGNDTMYPSIAMNGQGKGVLGFTFAGLDYFPSTGWVSLTAAGAGGVIHVAGVGAGPDDGFTGLPQYYGGAGRWGDYSATVADEVSGLIYTAAEYIPGGPRTLFANWGTYIAKISP